CSAPRRPPACLPRRGAMDPLFAKVAGLDVHLKAIACAARGRQDSGKLLRQVRSVGTMTGDLRAVADWLQTLGVTHVALEATGVLWRPAWNVLGGPPHAAVGQPAAPQEGARPQDRRQRRGGGRPAAAGRAAQGPLRAAPPGARAARPDAAPGAA